MADPAAGSLLLAPKGVPRLEMVAKVLNLDDRHVGAVLTPRSDGVFLDVRG